MSAPVGLDTMARSEASSDIPGVRPDKCKVKCANCGAPVARLTSNTMADVPLSCDECPSGGTVVKNRYGYVSGTYGAVEVWNDAGGDESEAV